MKVGFRLKVRQDYVFMFSLDDGRTGFAFCPCENVEREQAKARIETVLQEQKKKRIQLLNYLGKLDYEHMESGIKDQLYIFEKYDPIWLCIIQQPS